MMKLTIKKASCHVEGDYVLSGSVLKGTVQVAHKGFRTHLEVESEEPREKLAHLIRCAKNGCFAEQLIVQPVPLESTITVNGEPLHLENIT
jgi:hypothetical protein